MTQVLVVHGGAGRVDPSVRAAHVAGCERAAAAGFEVLRGGGSALDAVQRAVQVLEDDPLYNAGTGGSLTRAGTLELDAALMDGASLRAGAVCALPPFPSPIAIARRVLEDGQHVLLAAEGAAAFAREQGFATSDAMITDKARERLERWRAGQVGEGWAGGTVGAVACDGRGHVAAATSTGGTVGKRPGRVGDSPILGAGTWADDETGACSATGVGEAILRVGLARVACEGAATDAQAAVERALARLEARVGGEAGLILVTP
ncbi:MAG: isoaspartyl peptidase/L-asparaginase, partial [Myxococcales bacterium]|nr:isoaspartyl peptidase/L-asparaginase [Myxococcales bacterium]